MQQYCDQSLQLTNIRTIIPTFRDRIKLVKQEQCVALACVVEHRAYIVSRSAEKAAHHCREIEGDQRFL
ncbi:hypothetical protein WK53_02945 [Burkholderia ubonensis]|uniref:Uncharacterized protein n=1 Tax=Burkholderia ubonensis TaxID=101571 RepID=A0AAW3NG72_9BURK|nr:hypothetical protein WK53_02945 [Burkholderia ubonensis]